MSQIRSTRRLLLGAAGGLALPAGAQGFPSRPVRVIIGFPPGGSNDAAARILQPRLQELLGQPIDAGVDVMDEDLEQEFMDTMEQQEIAPLLPPARVEAVVVVPPPRELALPAMMVAS